MTSGLSGDMARLIMDTPGIARTERGPVASPELFVIVAHPTKKDPSDANEYQHVRNGNKRSRGIEGEAQTRMGAWTLRASVMAGES